MKRRVAVFASFALGGLGLPQRTFAQVRKDGKPYRIALLPDLGPDTSKVFLDTLAEAGRIEGRDFVLLRAGMAFGPPMEILIKRVLDNGPDLVFGGNTTTGRAVQQTKPNIPVVLWGGGFPVEGGLADSFAHPGRNVTGISPTADLELYGKYVQFLCDAKPGVKRVGVIWGQLPPSYPRYEVEHAFVQFREVRRKLNLDVLIIETPTPEDVDSAMATVSSEGIDALVLPNSRAVIVRIRSLLDFAIQKRLPTLTDINYGPNGLQPLISYGAPFSLLIRQAAGYVLRILWGGVKPGDLPIQMPSKIDLIINLKTAKALGITIPQSLLLRADEVIQ